MKFTKMHGCGNDYIYINGYIEKIQDYNHLAKKMSNRNFGVGSDGLVVILPSDTADFQMRMFNSDGSEAEMCGNAIRCVGKYVYDNKMTEKDIITVETLAGIKVLNLFTEGKKVVKVKVDMGEPILEANEIPVISDKKPVINQTIQAVGNTYSLTCVSMGNPHAVCFVDNIEDKMIFEAGPSIETNSIFPRKTNVEFARIIDNKTIEMRVWERGAGETLACGTGACATLVAAVLNDKVDREATVKLLGGDLFIEWDIITNHVFMTGPAETVFEGKWCL